MKNKIIVKALISADRKKVWEYWTKPEHIVHWNFASEEWHCPQAENDLQQGGQFNYRMAAKDGKMAFNFEGKHNKVIDQKIIDSHLEDGRKMRVEFEVTGRQTKVVETFEPDPTNPEDLQRMGWQAILNNFKKYVESN